MSRILYAVICVAATICLTTATTVPDANCHKYSDHQLDTSRCTHAMRVSDTGDFQDMFNLMNNAHTNEQRKDFVADSLIWMFKYIHCVSDIAAVSVLFYGADRRHLPNSHSQFWSVAYDALFKHGSPISSADESFLMNKIKNICADTDPSCVQWLIDKFTVQVTDHFKAAHPTFPDPSLYIRHTTTPPLPTTTSAPATQPPTSQPTSPPTSPASSTAATTTLASPSTTVPPATQVSCWQCLGIDCLLTNKLSPCPPGQVCMATMYEGNYGRDIERKCASLADCHAINNDAS